MFGIRLAPFVSAQANVLRIIIIITLHYGILFSLRFRRIHPTPFLLKRLFLNNERRKSCAHARRAR